MATVVTTSGLTLAASRFKGSIPEPKFLGWGTGAGNASPSDTSLFTEASEARVSGSSSSSSNNWQVTGILTANANKTITNAGLFSSSSGGTLFIHGSFSPIQVLSGQSLEFVITLSFN